MNATVPRPPDQEFELRLRALSRDARDAARFTYVGEAVRFCSAPTPELIARLDQFAGFWNTVLGGLQTGAIVALGRMYDQRKDVLSARRMLEYAATNRGLFSTASLSGRVAMRLSAPGDVAAYVADYQPPSQAQFDSLATALVDHTNLYENKIKDIRHKAFAHSGRITREELHAMFAAVPVADFERLTMFPLRLHDTIWETYVNGRELVLINTPTAIADLMANQLGPREIGMEHRYAVRDTTEFLEWLRSASGKERQSC